MEEAMNVAHEAAIWVAGLYVSLGVVAWVLMRVWRRVDSELVARYLSLGALVAGAVVPAFVSPHVFVASLVLAALACAYEVGGVATTVNELGRSASRRTALAGAAFASAAMITFVTRKPTVPPLMGFAVGIFGLGLPWLVLDAKGRLRPMIANVATWAWPAFSLATFALLSSRPTLFLDVVFLYVALEVSDSVAFIAGRSFGRHKLAPVVSPNKTWEGFFAGVCAAGAAGAALSFCQPAFSRAECAAIAIGLALLGTLADLSASAFKRAVGVKDYGSALGPHGGLLDAYDAMTLVGPFWWVWLETS
jgi:phosphatidate cytidylyltransferase